MTPNSDKDFGSPSRQAKHVIISANLRREIVKGIYPPGSRLPTHIELQRRYSTSTATVQHALDSLTRDGFAESRGRAGTFVSENPPHLCRYALVFPTRPVVQVEGWPWSRFWTALCGEAEALQREGRRRISVYRGVDGTAETDDYKRLLDDARSSRLAGIILIAPSDDMQGSPLFTEAEMPPVAAAAGPGDFPGVPTVTMDYNSFIDKALDYFARRGRRRVAAVGVWGGLPRSHEWSYLASAAEKRGLIHRPYWGLTVGPERLLTADRTAQLLIHAEEKPDALLIADDHLVEDVTTVLAAEGGRIGDLDVVAHCNFPYRPTAHVPVKFVGFDVRQYLTAFIDTLDLKRRGGKVPPDVSLPARYDD